MHLDGLIKIWRRNVPLKCKHEKIDVCLQLNETSLAEAVGDSGKQN